jgi:hypothetical protein
MRTKNTKMAAELRRMARKGRLSERSWSKHQALSMPWGETFISPTQASVLRSTNPERRL